MTQPDLHLLIVDDDERLRELLRKFLTRNGFWVTSARDPLHARRILSGLDFDLIIMDVMMPDEDGISFTRSLRRRTDVPILLLTARGDTEDRIAGLEAGADDYLAKPFEPKELLLRINAILRRVPNQSAQHDKPALLHMGQKRYDVQRGELWSGQSQVSLTRTEYELLRIFADSPGAAIARGTLAEQLSRQDGPVQERAVDVQITRLRRKLEADSKRPRYLQTIRGEGYMLCPDGYAGAE